MFGLTLWAVCMFILTVGACDSHARLTSEKDHSDGATFVYFAIFVLCLLAGFVWIAVTIMAVIV